MRLPLEDVSVIDLSHALAGPCCSTMLAGLGARVIESEAGDIARAWAHAAGGRRDRVLRCWRDQGVIGGRKTP